MGALLHEGFRAKLIQSNEGFNLYDLVEFRFFLDALNKPVAAEDDAGGLHGDSSPIISDYMWEHAKTRLRAVYAGSECLGDCLYLLDDFEHSNRKKYRSDLELMIRESNLDDFFCYRDDEIVVSTIHKSKSREFDNVFMSLSNFRCETDEARRRVYVGLTRARHRLHIHYNDDGFDGLKAPGVKRKSDTVMYPQPDELILQLSHKDIFLSFFININKKNAGIIRRLRSGSPLIVVPRVTRADADVNATGDDESNIDANANIDYSLYTEPASGEATTSTAPSTIGNPPSPSKKSGGVEIVRFSNAFKEAIRDFGRKGYVPVSAKVRFVVVWKNKDMREECCVVLPDVTFRRG